LFAKNAGNYVVGPGESIFLKRIEHFAVLFTLIGAYSLEFPFLISGRYASLCCQLL